MSEEFQILNERGFSMANRTRKRGGNGATDPALKGPPAGSAPSEGSTVAGVGVLKKSVDRLHNLVKGCLEKLGMLPVLEQRVSAVEGQQRVADSRLQSQLRQETQLPPELWQELVALDQELAELERRFSPTPQEVP